MICQYFQSLLKDGPNSRVGADQEWIAYFVPNKTCWDSDDDLPTTPVGDPTKVPELPLEILTKIFSLLRYSDIRDIRLVNKHWYRAALDTKFVRNEVLTMGESLKDILTDPLKFPDNHGVLRHRDFKHLRISICKHTIQEIKMVWSNKNMWTSYGPQLSTLTINSGTITEEQFFTALSFCTGLETLTIEGRFELRRATPFTIPNFELPYLYHFKLLTKKFDCELCEAIIARAPYLEVIEMKTPEDRTYKDWWSYIMADVNPDVLHVLRVEYHGTDKRRRPLEIDLFWQVLEMPNVRVEEFCSDKIYSWDALNCLSGLKRIELRNGTSNHLRLIHEIFPSIESLTLRHRGEFAPNLRGWHRLQNLTYLDLSMTYSEARCQEVLDGLCKNLNLKLQTLRLEIDGCLSQDGFVRLMKFNPLLKHLQIIPYRVHGPVLTDMTVQAIFKYQRCLEELDLGAGSEISDVGLSGEMLEERMNTRIYIGNPTGHPISQLQKLRKLRFSKIKGITGWSFDNHFRFPALTEVIFSDVPNLAERGVKSLVKNNPNIEVLGLDLYAWDGRYQDEGAYFPYGVIESIKTLRKLRRLRIKVGRTTLDRYSYTKRLPKQFQQIQEHFGKHLRIQLHNDSDDTFSGMSKDWESKIVVP